jgi:hypothetical protein
MVNSNLLPLVFLVGGDWIMTFPSYWEWKIIPTDELHDFSEG